MGGPVGAAIGVGMMAVEKITGIDFDKIGQTLVAGIENLNHHVTSPAQAARAAAPATPAPPSAQCWPPIQLAPYGVSTSLDGTLNLANLSGTDVFNSLELSRIHVAQTAYGRVASLAS
jgi:hypothetical protein